MDLWTKGGKPLQVRDEFIFSKNGAPVGRIYDDRVFGPNGHYVGSIVGDRLVYRHSQSATVKSSFSIAHIGGCGRCNRAGSAMWGDEPDIPD